MRPGFSGSVADEDGNPSYTVRPGSSPLVLSIPHAGTGLPESIRVRMRERARALPDTDHGIPALYDFVGTATGADGEADSRAGNACPLAHASVIQAHGSRYLIDLNRDPSGASLYPGRPTTELVPTVCFDGRPIWLDGEEPAPDEIEERRARWFDPYHAELDRLLRTIVDRHGWALLWDAHSIRSRVPRLFDGTLPDLNLGTNSGLSCAPAIRDAATRVLAQVEEFTTVVDGRFTGGWITRRYGRPERHIHALQMEIALGAFLTEEAEPWTLDPARAERLRDVLKSILTATLNAAAELHEGALR